MQEQQLSFILYKVPLQHLTLDTQEESAALLAQHVKVLPGLGFEPAIHVCSPCSSGRRIRLVIWGLLLSKQLITAPKDWVEGLNIKAFFFWCFYHLFCLEYCANSRMNWYFGSSPHVTEVSKTFLLTASTKFTTDLTKFFVCSFVLWRLYCRRTCQKQKGIRLKNSQ